MEHLPVRYVSEFSTHQTQRGNLGHVLAAISAAVCWVLMGVISRGCMPENKGGELGWYVLKGTFLLPI